MAISTTLEIFRFEAINFMFLGLTQQAILLREAKGWDGFVCTRNDVCCIYMGSIGGPDVVSVSFFDLANLALDLWLKF